MPKGFAFITGIERAEDAFIICEAGNVNIHRALAQAGYLKGRAVCVDRLSAGEVALLRHRVASGRVSDVTKQTLLELLGKKDLSYTQAG